MTLRSRLLLAIFFVFFIVFFGLLYLSVHTTRNYLQQQLASHAQDAATSLSYPLADTLAKNDALLADAQVSAIFDRGYFQQIIVRSIDKKDLIKKELPARIENVPLWFTRLFPLETQPGEAFISSGWRQLGKVIVVSQPTFAYQHLWLSLVELSWWMLCALLLALGLTFLLLRVVLKPLLNIESAALAIREKRFVQIPLLPKARELRRVVVAMNDMSRRAAENLDAEIEKAEHFRQQAYADSLTGLENRLAFDLRLDQLLEESDKFQSATLIMLELEGLREYNLALGYEQGNAMLQGVAQRARDLLGGRAEVLSRSGSASFAFVCLDLSDDARDSLIAALQRGIEAELVQCGAAELLAFSLGCAVVRAGETREHVMARADLAIETARQASRNGFAVIKADNSDVNSLGSLDWRKTIQGALAENRWTLLAQPVVTLRDRAIFHHEIMGNLIDEKGNRIGAAQFLPMALRHQMMAAVDQALVAGVIDFMNHKIGNIKRVAINISAQAIDSPEFTQWLAGKLKAMGARAKQLAFEVSEFACAGRFDAMRSFAGMVRNGGAAFGIDRFGLEADSLHALRHFPPDYIKLDGRLVREATDVAVSRAHLQAIVRLAASLDIPVFAQSVESESMVQLLLADKVEGGQGYYFGAPHKL